LLPPRHLDWIHPPRRWAAGEGARDPNRPAKTPPTKNSPCWAWRPARSWCSWPWKVLAVLEHANQAEKSIKSLWPRTWQTKGSTDSSATSASREISRCSAWRPERTERKNSPI
jgi:hypothetical protein